MADQQPGDATPAAGLPDDGAGNATTEQAAPMTLAGARRRPGRQRTVPGERPAKHRIRDRACSGAVERRRGRTTAGAEAGLVVAPAAGAGGTAVRRSHELGNHSPGRSVGRPGHAVGPDDRGTRGASANPHGSGTDGSPPIAPRQAPAPGGPPPAAGGLPPAAGGDRPRPVDYRPRPQRADQRSREIRRPDRDAGDGVSNGKPRANGARTNAPPPEISRPHRTGAPQRQRPPTAAPGAGASSAGRPPVPAAWRPTTAVPPPAWRPPAARPRAVAHRTARTAERGAPAGRHTSPPPAPLAAPARDRHAAGRRLLLRPPGRIPELGAGRAVPGDRGAAADGRGPEPARRHRQPPGGGAAEAAGPRRQRAGRRVRRGLRRRQRQAGHHLRHHRAPGHPAGGRGGRAAPPRRPVQPARRPAVRSRRDRARTNAAASARSTAARWWCAGGPTTAAWARSWRTAAPSRTARS